MYNFLIFKFGTDKSSIYIPFCKTINTIKRVKNMKDKKLTIMKWIFKIVLITVLSFMYYLSKPVDTSKVIYIPKGSINEIIAQLNSKNYDLNKLDSLVLRVLGSPQSGWIDIGSNRITKADFLYRLTTAKAALQNVTLIPGETTYIFLNQLASTLNLDRDKLQREYDRQTTHKEGAFVPNTYRLPIGITEKELIRILLHRSSQQMKDLSIKLFGTYNEKKWFGYIAIASVIQKEAATVLEMPLVSSVIHNRVERGMLLQMDGTLNYGKYSHIRVTPKRIKEDSTIFNTYRYKGVPPVPVCNVSFDAIRAAVFPAKTSYLYFMKNKHNRHDFSSNYSTHLHNIKRATK